MWKAVVIVALLGGVLGVALTTDRATLVLAGFALTPIGLWAATHRGRFVLLGSPALILMIPYVPFAPLAPGVVFAVLLAAASPARLTWRLVPRRVSMPVWAFLAVVFGSLVFGGSQLGSAVMVMVTFTLPLLLVVSIANSDRQFSLLVDATVSFIAIGAVLALYERTVGARIISNGAALQFFYPPLRNGQVRVQGLFPHPVVLAVVLALGIALAIGRLLGGSRIMWLPISLMSVALIVTFSRGPLVGAIVGMSVSILVTRGRSARRLLRVAAVGIVIVAATPMRTQLVDGFTALITTDNSSDEAAASVPYRLATQAAMIDFSLQHPGGVGIGGLEGQVVSTVTSDGRTINAARSIDNTYLLAFVELGWLGGSLLTLLLVTVASWTLGRARRFRTDPTYGPLLAMIGGAQVGFLLTAYTVASIATWVQMSIAYWVVAGLGVAASNLAGKAPPTD